MFAFAEVRITNHLVPIQLHLAEWEQRHFTAEAGAAIDPAVASAMLNAGVGAGFFLANRTLVDVV